MARWNNVGSPRMNLKFLLHRNSPTNMAASSEGAYEAELGANETHRQIWRPQAGCRRHLGYYA